MSKKIFEEPEIVGKEKEYKKTKRAFYYGKNFAENFANKKKEEGIDDLKKAIFWKAFFSLLPAILIFLLILFGILYLLFLFLPFILAIVLAIFIFGLLLKFFQKIVSFFK